MSIERLGTDLQALGVSGRDVRSLLLLPQIYVGWASERRDRVALEALLDTTARSAGFDAPSYALARGWLFEEPTRSQFQSGFALLRALRCAPEDPLIQSSDVLEAMLWACRAAQLDREPTPSGRGPVTAAARRALFDLQIWLEVDIDDVAADLLAEGERGMTPPLEEHSGVRHGPLHGHDGGRAGPPPQREGRPTPPGPGRRVLELVEDDERATHGADPGDVGVPASAPFPLSRRLG